MCTPLPYFFRSRLNIISPVHFGFSSGSFPSSFPNKTLCIFLVAQFVLHVHTIQLTLITLPNDVWRRVRFVSVFVVQLLLLSVISHVLDPNIKTISVLSTLFSKHPQSVFFPQGRTASSTPYRTFVYFNFYIFL